MPRRLALVVLLAFLVVADARATTVILPLAPDSPRPAMVYTIRADDGATTYTGQVRVEAVSGFARIATSDVPTPVADVRAMQFSYPAGSFDLTIGAARQIPFSLTIDAITESVKALLAPNLEEGAIASFGLGFDGEQTSSITRFPWLQRESFGFTFQSAGSVFTQSGGADCTSPGCVFGTFAGTIETSALTRLEFNGSAGDPRDPLDFALGTDGLGITWTVAISTEYRHTPNPRFPSVESFPIVFVPESASGALLGLGLVVLAAWRRRTQRAHLPRASGARSVTREGSAAAG